eukprot:1156999-Pelagomonas_calceolata.AAC.2
MFQTDTTANSMFLPSWRGPISINPYSRLLNAYPHLCCTLRTIPSAALNYATPLLLGKCSRLLGYFWFSKEFMLPRHSWSLQIFAVWNTAARIRLNENNPTWLTDLARHIPEARWWKTIISNDPVLNPRHPGIETGIQKFEKLPSDQQHTPMNNVQSQQPLSPLSAPDPNLVPKVQNWKVQAYTDGSCHKHM